MSVIKDQAVVLRPIDFSETSQILVLLTREHGKLRFLCKGIKRGTRERYAPAVDALELGDVAWSARNENRSGLLTLTEWSQRQAFVGLRERLDRLYPAMYAAEATSEMVLDGDPHPLAFDALVALLERMTVAAGGLPDLCAYQLKLLEEVGLTPVLKACSVCGRVEFADQERVYFSSTEGGLLCRDCEPARVEKRMVPAALARALQQSVISAATPAQLFDLLDYHITHQLGRPLRLAEFILPGRSRRTLA